MAKQYIVLLLFIFSVICVTLGQEQLQETTPSPEPESVDKSDSAKEEEDKYEVESKQDYDKTTEKEKELKLLRKAKRLKESNYRRALESILPAKNTDGYRRFFEDLINNSDEKSKTEDTPQKEVEEVIVTDTFVDGDQNDENADLDPQVEEIEVVIEHITDDNNDTTDSVTEPYDSTTPGVTRAPKIEIIEMPYEEPESKSHPHLSPRPTPLHSIEMNPHDRTGQDGPRGTELDALHMGHLEERRLLEPIPINRYSEVVIPHYRTTLTRNGVVVSPALYTVQTSSPMIEHVATRSWLPNLPNRGIKPEIFARSGNKMLRPDIDPKSIDDYNDYGSNAYSYAPSHNFQRSRGDLITRLTEASLHPQLGNLKQYRDNLYPGAFYPQAQRFFPDTGYRPYFRIRR